MKIARKVLPVLILGAAITLTTSACKSKSEDDDETEDEDTPSGTAASGGGSSTTSTATQPGSADTMPQIGAIALEGVGSGSSLRLTQSDDGSQCDQGDLGVMGLALGGACHTAPFAARMMLGNESGDFDGDGDMDCSDLAAAKAANKDAGLMLHLLCEDVMLRNDGITSLAFSDQDDPAGGVFSISFADFANDTMAAGSWTQGNTASYPADIRIFSGATFETQQGFAALGLTNTNNGAVAVQIAEGDQEIGAVVQFSNKTATDSCQTSPGDENCHWQDIRIYAGEGAVTDGPPNGFHLKILADDKKAPKFIALEGRYRYTEAGAAGMFSADDPDADQCPRSVMPNMRGVYFQTIQKGGQIWGRFRFTDANGDLLTCDMGGGVDPFALMASEDGICQNLGTSEWTTCTDVSAADAAAISWGGDAFEDIDATPVKVNWDGAPTSQGICTAAGCRDFAQSDFE